MSWLNTILTLIVNVISSIIKIKKSDRIIKPQIIPRKIFCFYVCGNRCCVCTSKPSGHGVTFPDTLGRILRVVCARKSQQCSRACCSTTRAKNPLINKSNENPSPHLTLRWAFFKENGTDLLVNLQSHVRFDIMWWIWRKTVLTGAEKSRPWVQTCGLVTTKTFETLHMLRLLVYFCVLFRY